MATDVTLETLPLSATDVTPETLPLSVNFIEQALHHVNFLANVESIPELKQPAVLLRALYRYETYWLPLAAEHTQECLSAPLDIEWIWHCHMLGPKLYAKDCEQVAGTIVPHTLRSQEEYKIAIEQSHEYWKQKYGDTPFLVDYKVPLDTPAPEGFETKITYKVIEAAGRQKVFFYQVSLPHYKDRNYLEGSLFRYRQFLFLKTKHPKAFSVPCFEMDLMWHTHLVNPLHYRKDTIAILGHVFNHDDTVNDRSEGSKLVNCTEETEQHWKELFNESLFSPGAMYRGQPPGGILYKLSDEQTNSFSTKIVTVTLNRLLLKLPPESNLNEYKGVRISAHGCAGTRNVIKWFSLNKTKHHASITEIDFEVNGESIVFNTKSMNKVSLGLETKSGRFACFSHANEDLGSAVYDMLPKIEKSANITNGTFQTAQTLSDGSIINMNCSVSKPARGPAVMLLQAGSEEPAVIPDNVQSLLGPVNLERLYSGTDNTCVIRTIRLKNHMGKMEFTGKVIFSKALMLHFIQIFYHDKMVAVCHHIGCEQLPSPSQVEKAVITLNHCEGERALLIKNHAGDWGIIKGNVMRNETRAMNETTSTNGVSGRLWLYFYKTTTGMCEETVLDPSKNSGHVTLDSTRIDLRKGTIEVRTESAEVGERIALAFCISLLQKRLLPKLV